MFSGTELVHMVNQIIVPPIANAELSSTRWFFLMSLKADGKTQVNQLSMPTEVNKGYTVEDNSWYDPPSGRFVRLLTKDGKPIYASSFDGTNIYSLDIPEKGTPNVVKTPITKDFKPPHSPAEFLGIAAGLKNRLETNDKELFKVEDAGKVKLEDGAEAHILKGSTPKFEKLEDTYILYTIREDNNTIEKMELFANGQSYLIVSRSKTETGKEPKSGWNLAGIAEQVGGDAAQAGPSIRRDMIIQDVSVEDMVKRADYPVYILVKNPEWIINRKITDLLDLGSPPHRMFMIIYQAKDQRHIMLIHMYSLNKMIADPKGKENVFKNAKLVYTSPSGVKVWFTSESKRQGQMMLTAKAVIPDIQVKDPIAYLLETPENTFPMLIVNDNIADEELHAVVDSIVPAKK